MSEDTSWVFDSLVCFLHGPIWNAPLQTFVEEKSLIFDPNEHVNDKNPEYTIIHDEYKNLVDYMLGSFMDEMQISPEQFEVACLEGRQGGGGSSNAFSFHQGLFQQIWAANDIRIFIRMMTQRNVELQLQALDLIERRQNSQQKDDDEIAKVKRAEAIDDGDDGDVAGGGEGPADLELAKLFIAKPEDDEIAEKEIFMAVEKEMELPAEQKSTEESSEKEQTKDKFQRLNLFFERETVSSADVQTRQEYLRAQRDKILEIKKKARAHQLNESVKKNGRPTSAQAAQNVLASGSGGAAAAAAGTINEASLQLRKTLAKRLRTEVVENQ